MKFSQTISDKIAMSLSFACVLHCLFMPAFLISSATFVSLQFSDEYIHYFILMFAMPLSLYALLSGRKNHNNNFIFLVGVIGLAILLGAVFTEANVFGFETEIFLSLTGSALVIAAHYKNYQTCQRLDCTCHEEKF